MHALEVKPLKGSNNYKQSRHLQLTPNPGRFALIGDTGTGKSAAAAKIFDGLFSICSRWHLIASTIETDGSFSEMKSKIINGLKEQGVDWADPQETPFHESIDALKQIIAQCRRRTLQAKEEEKEFLPQTFLYLDDMITWTRHSTVLDHLLATSRHIGLNIVICMQQYVGLSTLQRKSMSHIAIFKLLSDEKDFIFETLVGKKIRNAKDSKRLTESRRQSLTVFCL